ncbi:MAG: tetratricopeptide repeat protein [Bacteroidales bacterium]|jgi:tetratricopeptide (TPR) repeat protein|nr:tetratricopeptide repeat protein [Bacteroidales bacterium]
MKKIFGFAFCLLVTGSLNGQINTDRIMANGKSALYFDDYVLAIQYFNQVIKAKPYLAEPYFYRGIAKLNLNDFRGATEDCSLCLERNPFIIKAYECRAIARQQLEQFDEAISDYSKVLEYYPNDKELMHNQAVAYAQKKNYEAAEKVLNEIISRYPDFDKAYLTRGCMLVETGDTVQALKDLDKAIELDKFSSYAFATRALIAYQHENYQLALNDYTEAIRLSPQQGYYVNRGLTNYQLSNLREAMDDYDKAVELDSDDIISRYNRGILRAQVADNNRAIEDFDKVLEIEPKNYFATYNRAMLRTQTGDYAGAIADYSSVLEEYPDFTSGYQSRSVAKRLMGDAAGADRDLMTAWRIEEKYRRNKRTDASQENQSDSALADGTDDEKKTREQSDKNIRNFNKVVVAENSRQTTQYESEIRGRIQDKNVKLDILPMFVTTYYEKVDAVKTHAYYEQTLFNFNKRMDNAQLLRITNAESSLTEEQIERHFESIRNHSQEIAKNPTDSVAYFLQGLDYFLVQDFQSAIDAFSRAVDLNDHFILARFNRSVARSKLLEYETAQNDISSEHPKTAKTDLLRSNLPADIMAKGYDYSLIINDYEKIITFSPEFFFAYFNMGNIRIMQKNYTAAINEYTKAIQAEPEFAEAWFNRGVACIYSGQNDKAIADLSKAGELGIVASYNIIKRLREMK